MVETQAKNAAKLRHRCAVRNPEQFLQVDAIAAGPVDRIADYLGIEKTIYRTEADFDRSFVSTLYQ